MKLRTKIWSGLKSATATGVVGLVLLAAASLLLAGCTSLAQMTQLIDPPRAAEQSGAEKGQGEGKDHDASGWFSPTWLGGTGLDPRAREIERSLGVE